MKSLRRMAAVAAGAGLLTLGLGSATAEEPKRPSVDALNRSIVSRTPQTRVKKVDRERLTARRIDIVDEAGVIRMTLGAPTPEGIVDGIQYKRSFPAAGLVIYDKNGNERGGFAVGDIEGSAAVTAQDHINGDAIGWRVMPDGSVSFAINERPPIIREPALGNAIVPGVESATRIRMDVAADGAPSISLADKQDRPRVRIKVTQEGYGAIEFLDAEGKVVETLAPEADRQRASVK
jgi:hypothetical protein